MSQKQITWLTMEMMEVLELTLRKLILLMDLQFLMTIREIKRVQMDSETSIKNLIWQQKKMNAVPLYKTQIAIPKPRKRKIKKKNQQNKYLCWEIKTQKQN